MGSSYRSNSAHMADIKGKGILYEDDDEPIKLTDHDVSQNINEFKLSLIGKILNPKKQSVEKLLQKMPVQWGMEDRITANDLGNVWTRLIGVPLHLWTENNLREIGSRLGHVHQDTIELIEGRMLLDFDSRRPLKFARKAESPEGDEVTIEIKYEMLFKYCSTCGMLTHEKEYCPSIQRQGVFARVQLQEHRPQQYSKPLVKKEPNALHSKALAGPYLKQSSYATGRQAIEGQSYDLNNPREAYKGHADRVIRRRDEPSWRRKYGGAREEAKPYDRYIGATWREKKSQPQGRHDGNVVRDRLVRVSLDRVDGPDDHQRQRASSPPRESAKSVQADCGVPPLQSPARPSPDQRGLGRATGTRRIASTIVTPSRGDGLDGNVTKRLKGTPRSLAFDTLTEQDPKPTTENDQVIEALDDMDITEQLDDGLMDSEIQDDDLMGVELAEMEAKSRQGREVRGSDQKSQRLAGRSSRHIKHGYKSSAPLGIQKKKFEILVRGSTQKRSKSDGSSHVFRESGGTGGLRRHHHSSRKRTGSSKDDGLMGSKNPSHFDQ
ncbi:hypothetical protein Bca101_050222 [Brassica carinata]